MASDGRPPGKVLPLTWVQTKRGLVALGILILWVCWTEYYRLPCHLSGSVVRHHRLVRSPEDEKEYHSRCSFLCGHWDYCLCHVWVFGRKLPQGPVNLRGEKHL